MLAFVSALILSFIWIWRQAFAGAAGLFFVVLLAALILGHLQRRESLHDVGFRLDTFGRASALLVPLAAIVIAFIVLVGVASGSARFPPTSTAIVDIAKLTAFGLAQQYVLLAFFYRRLAQALPKPLFALFATATVFALFSFAEFVPDGSDLLCGPHRRSGLSARTQPLGQRRHPWADLVLFIFFSFARAHRRIACRTGLLDALTRSVTSC